MISGDYFEKERILTEKSEQEKTFYVKKQKDEEKHECNRKIRKDNEEMLEKYRKERNKEEQEELIIQRGMFM